MQNPVFKKLNFNKFLQKHYTYFFTTKIIKLRFISKFLLCDVDGQFESNH